jgi:hypothetical protein
MRRQFFNPLQAVDGVDEHCTFASHVLHIGVLAEAQWLLYCRMAEMCNALGNDEAPHIW